MLEPTKYLDWLKLSGKSAFILLILSSVLLFGNAELINKLGLFNIRESVKLWLGVVWLLSLSITVAEIVYPAYQWLKEKLESRSNLKRLQKRLHNLSADEKAFLLGYIQNNTRTQSAAYSNGMVNGLVAEKIVYRSSQMAHYYNVFAYNIQPWAWDYLNNHPECFS